MTANPVEYFARFYLFYRRVGTVTRHLRSVTFYFTDESEPSLVIVSAKEQKLLFVNILKEFQLFYKGILKRLKSEM